MILSPDSPGSGIGEPLTFQTTESHYIMAQARLAGRALARAISRYE